MPTCGLLGAQELRINSSLALRTTEDSLEPRRAVKRQPLG